MLPDSFVTYVPDYSQLASLSGLAVMKAQPQKDFERMLHPEQLRDTLLAVSLFVMAFEMFRDRVVAHPRSLHENSFDENGWHVDNAEYRASVLSRHKSPFQASLLWFLEHGALSVEELDQIASLRRSRNQVVHDLSSLLGSAALPNVGEQFTQLVALFRKLELWWFRSVEQEFNPDLDGVEFADDEYTSGSILVLRMLVDSAVGEGDQAWRWYNAFVEAKKATGDDSAAGSA